MWWVLTDVYTVLIWTISAVAMLIVVCCATAAGRRAFNHRRYRIRDQLRARYEPIVSSLRPGTELSPELNQPKGSPAWEVIEVALLDALKRADGVVERGFLSGVCWHLGYVEWHIHRLSTGRPRRRALAADHLGAMRHPAAVAALAGALYDADLDVRTVAARALGMIGGDDAWDHLVQRLLSGSGDEPDISLRVLKSILVSGGPAVVARLVDSLGHPRWRIRSAVVDVLGNIGANAAGPQLAEMLSDPEPDVRAKVARVLGQLGYGPAVPALHNVLDDTAWVVRMHATRSLGVLGGASTSALLDRLVDTKWHVRAAAAEALRRGGSNVVWLVWSTLSQYQDRYVREQLFEELQRSSLLQAYIGMLDSDIPEERARSTIIVEECLREGVTSLIVHLLKTHRSAEVRGRLVTLLTPYCRPEIVAALEKVAANDPEPNVRRLAQATLEVPAVPLTSHGSDGRVV